MYRSQRSCPRWHTPDAAIREVIERSPLRMRSPSLSPVKMTTPESAADAMDAHTKVQSALGKFSREEREVLVRYAFKQSYRRIGEVMGFSAWKARSIRTRCWGTFRDRLVALGLVDKGA